MDERLEGAMQSTRRIDLTDISRRRPASDPSRNPRQVDCISGNACRFETRYNSSGAYLIIAPSTTDYIVEIHAILLLYRGIIRS